jgi:two-component system, NarL family, sensor histidine kinase UhpB
MWQRLSLRGRINLLLALILMLGLTINVARLALEAAPRVQAEDQSVTRLAREFTETMVTTLNESPDPEARLDQIVRDLKRLRHVSITRRDDGNTTMAAPDETDEAASVPAWFVGLVHPEKSSVSVPVSIDGKETALVITSIPNDEIAEIWDGIVTQLEVGSAVAVALFLITMTVVGRALAPLEALAQAMVKIEAGSYDARVEPKGAPELAAICTRLNHLAMTLGEAVEEKRRLVQRAVSLQDLERKDIARELHDEFGPYLFVLRAHVGAMMRLAETREPELRKHCSAILEQVDGLQRLTRRILEKLRPVGLAELGLREALGALLRFWNESRPDVNIDTTISQALGETGETADLTIYRVVQEALTNIFRHADATEVSVSIAPVERSAGSADARDYTVVRVCDNGRGLKPDHKFGLGLIGMRERLLALGGALTVASGEGGVTVEAMIPTSPA